VIEHSVGANLFGYESFLDANGATVKLDLIGSVETNPATGRVDIVMVHSGFFIDINVIDVDHLVARLVRTDDTPTTFLVSLSRHK